MKHLIALLFVVFPVAAFAQAGIVPDDSKTPGLWRQNLTEQQIKTTVWGNDERAVSTAMRQQVNQRDHVAGTHDKSCGTPRCELDHRFPRCLGGADDVRNLWMQAAPWWHWKDLVEDHACADFRSGKITLQVARSYFEKDWRIQFKADCASKEISAAICQKFEAASK